MTILVTTFFVSLVIASVLRRRLHVILILYLAGWAMLPASALTIVGYDANFDIHPSSVLVLVAVVVAWLDDKNFGRKIISIGQFELLLMTVVLVTVLIISIQHRPTDLGVVIDQVYAPAAAFVLVVTLGDQQRKKVAKTFLTVASLEAVLSVLQTASSSPIVYSNAFPLDLVTSGSDGSTRWMGTFDHPLVLAAVCLTAMSMLDLVSNMLMESLLTIVLLLGIIAAQARTASVLVVVIAIALCLSLRVSSKRRKQRVVFWVLLLAIAFVGFTSTGLATRFGEDGAGSSIDRQSAYQVWLQIAGQFALHPQGSGMSYFVAQDQGLDTSFENAFFIYWVDFGSIAACAWIGWQLIVVLRGLQPAYYSVMSMGGLVAAVSLESFSSVGANSAIGGYMFIVYGLITRRDEVSFTQTLPPRVLTKPANPRRVAPIGIGRSSK